MSRNLQAFGVNGGDGMIIFYEYLINEALRIVDLKGTVDDIKAGNDLKEINRIISCLEVNINISLYIQKNIKEGIALNRRLREEYPEIQNMCDVINNMSPNRNENIKSVNASISDELKEILRTDQFGIMTGVLIKHNVVSDIKEFVQEIT